MNVIKFAEEFTQLLVRWTSPVTNDKDTANPIKPLSNQQVISAINDVLHVILGVNLQGNDYSSVKTPAMGIAVCTPSAPTVPKIHVEQINTTLSRFRSLDALTTDISNSENLNLPDSGNASSKSEEKLDAMETDNIDTLPGEKKIMSRSSPAINLSAVNRSDTFVQVNATKRKNGLDNSNEKKDEDKSNETLFDVFEKAELDVANNPEKLMSRSFLQKIDELRQRALEIVSDIDAVKREACTQSTKPIRRLSSVSGFPGLTRSSTLIRPVPPPKLRRSSTGFPGTPTSSKLNTTVTKDNDDPSSRRKSIAVSSVSLTAMSKMMSTNKKSTLSGDKPTKTSKYAHVQSTIPKASIGKRKAP